MLYGVKFLRTIYLFGMQFKNTMSWFLYRIRWPIENIKEIITKISSEWLSTNRSVSIYLTFLTFSSFCANCLYNNRRNCMLPYITELNDAYRVLRHKSRWFSNRSDASLSHLAISYFVQTVFPKFFQFFWSSWPMELHLK